MFEQIQIVKKSRVFTVQYMYTVTPVPCYLNHAASLLRFWQWSLPSNLQYSRAKEWNEAKWSKTPKRGAWVRVNLTFWLICVMHTVESIFFNFVIEYLGEIETEFENTLPCLSGPRWFRIMEKIEVKNLVTHCMCISQMDTRSRVVCVPVRWIPGTCYKVHQSDGSLIKWFICTNQMDPRSHALLYVDQSDGSLAVCVKCTNQMDPLSCVLCVPIRLIHPRSHD